jgi:hypothetical protein
LLSIYKLSVAVFSMASLVCAEKANWEPGKVISVEQVSTPAKEPGPECSKLPRGATPPVQCRPASLKAQRFWRVTVETGNKRYVVRPYKAPKFLDALNQDGPNYVDPKLTAGSGIEVAVYSGENIRLRTDRGEGLPASVESEDIISKDVVSKVNPTPLEGLVRAQAAPPIPNTAPVPAAASARSVETGQPEFRIVLLDNGDFIDLEVQEAKPQDIGDGAALFSFAGDSSRARVSSNKPVFMILGGSDAGMPELSRLQVGKGTRELVYSQIRKKSASSLPVTVTKVSDTLRRATVGEPLAAGEYVFVVPGFNRAFLFSVR